MLIAQSDYRGWDAVEMARLVRERQVTAVADLADGAQAGPPDEGGPTGEGALAGVPFAVKELLAWPGLPWTMGSRLMARNPAPGLSPYAARVRDCGLNVICSATSSEFGLLGSTESALRGTTLNPWRDGLSAGGSSGGASGGSA